MSGLGWIAIVLAGGLLAWSLWEPHWPRVERRLLSGTQEPARSGPPSRAGNGAGIQARALRVLHLSDLHLRGRGLRERRTLAAARRLEPDLICLTGDLAEPPGLDALASWAAQMASVAPVFAVLGDHDLLLPPEQRTTLETTLRRAGVHLLRNRSSWVSGPGWRAWVVGVDDARKGVADLGRAMAGDAAWAARNGVPLQGEEVRLLLSHRPALVDEASQKGFQLVLAGDTHGGQVNLPWLGPIAVWAKERSPYPGGLYRLGRTWLHVSRGIGWSHLPVRFRCRPEVALLEIPLKGPAEPVSPATGSPEPAVESHTLH